MFSVAIIGSVSKILTSDARIYTLRAELEFKIIHRMLRTPNLCVIREFLIFFRK